MIFLYRVRYIFLYGDTCFQVVAYETLEISQIAREISPQYLKKIILFLNCMYIVELLKSEINLQYFFCTEYIIYFYTETLNACRWSTCNTANILNSMCCFSPQYLKEIMLFLKCMYTVELLKSEIIDI